ncbi:MAG: HAMP domain-containing protein [Geobacter sp.]|nr:HAMP domain-containing protein [Geobacter sp.]
MNNLTGSQPEIASAVPVLRKSLKVRFTLLSMIILLACIWSLAYYVSETLRKDLEDLLGEQLFSTASIVAADVNQEIDFRLRSLERIAEGVFSVTPLKDTVRLQKLLDERLVLQNMFNGGYYVIKADGVVVGDYPRSTGRIGMNVSERGWMVEALKGRSAIGKPVVGKMLQVPVFTMASPIRDTDGTVIGVLAGVIDLKKPSFLDKITGNKYGTTGDYLLVAPQHRLIVTSSDKHRVMQSLPATGINPAIDRHIAGFEGHSVLTNPWGVELLAAVKRIPAAGWYLSVTLPTSEAFAPIRAMQQRIVLAALLVTILSGGLTWWMLRRQLAPILDTVTRLNALSHTDMPVADLPITRQDEVGLLIGAFNRLLEKLTTREALLLENEQRLKSLVTLFQHPSDTIQEFLDNALDEAIRLTKSQVGYIYFYHEDRQEFELNSWSKEVMQQCSVTNPQTRYHLDKTGIWGEAVRQRKPIIINDLTAENPLKKGYPEGHVHLSRFMTVPVFSQGALVAVVGVANKISEYNQTDLLQLTLLMDSVWQYVENKRGEIALLQERSAKAHLERQLQQAQKLEALGRLAGGIAHDFNNNIMIITGNAELAGMQPGIPAKAQEHLHDIVKAAQHSRDITAQLLAFSRQQAITPQTVDVNHAITDIQRSLVHLIGNENSVRLCLAEQIWPVRIDPSQLVQVIINLAVNARDAMPEGGSFTIETRNVMLDPECCCCIDECVVGEHVLLSFSDTGTGIAPEMIKQVFEPFFTTKECGKGTGLGLSTVYGIVRQNNGFIAVTSEAGQGTAIKIYLPRFNVAQEETTL